MTQELEAAIEGLYKTFSLYPFKSTLEGCPCCVSAADREQLHTNQLRDLTGEDLSRYAFKAMTTWGDLQDFKHYLPRIFELASTTDFVVDTFVIIGKLTYGNWRCWPQEEQEAVKKLLLAWWADSITNKNYFEKELFAEVSKLMGTVSPLLDRWNVTLQDNTFRNYVEVMYDQHLLVRRRLTWLKELDPSSQQQFETWLTTNIHLLESGFFHYSETDPELAGKISNILYVLEHNS